MITREVMVTRRGVKKELAQLTLKTKKSLIGMKKRANTLPKVG
jgi:hypothetical protein